MAIWHLRSKRKLTGGMRSRIRKKRKMDRGSKFLETRIAEKKIKIKKTRGNNKKIVALSLNKVNVSDTKTKKIQTAKIISVVENPANPHYARRNVITKGAVVKTDMGLVRITNRPNQEGMANGVLIGEKK